MLLKRSKRPNCEEPQCKRRARFSTIMFLFLEEEPQHETLLCRKHNRVLEKDKKALADHDNEVLKGRR